MAEQTTSTFNYYQAQIGASVGYVDSDSNIQVATYISFEDDAFFDGFVSFGDKARYGFTMNGTIYNTDGTEFGQLVIVESTIEQTTGTKIAKVTDSSGTSHARPLGKRSTATTSDDDSDETEEIFSIATLQPREELAMHCLAAMIGKYDNPLNFDNTKIKQLVSKAFLFAQECINQAVLYREKETTSSTVESSKYATVDSDSLSSDTDKLLYNISTAIANFMAQSKNQYADQQKNGLKVADITTTISGNVNADVSGSVSADVSGNITTKQEADSSTETTS